MVTRYEVITSRWSSHFWVKMHVFSNSFNNKSKACGWSDAKWLFTCYFTCHAQKIPFFAVLIWFLILGKVEDGGQCGDHYCWRHRAPAAPPPINIPHWEDQRLSTEGKSVSKYRNMSKNSGERFHQHSTPLYYGGGINLSARLTLNKYRLSMILGSNLSLAVNINL